MYGLHILGRFTVGWSLHQRKDFYFDRRQPPPEAKIARWEWGPHTQDASPLFTAYKHNVSIWLEFAHRALIARPKKRQAEFEIEVQTRVYPREDRPQDAYICEGGRLPGGDEVSYKQFAVATEHLQRTVRRREQNAMDYYEELFGRCDRYVCCTPILVA
jgi:hypothetical protein